jgi:hypothetical protein
MPWWKRWIAWIVQTCRYHKVNKATAQLMMTYDVNIFSPITHSHPLPKYMPKDYNTHEFWLKLDFNWISACDELWVYCQKGWDKSTGVDREITQAHNWNIPVRYIDPDDFIKRHLPK